jgi:hypothetical protein
MALIPYIMQCSTNKLLSYSKFFCYFYNWLKLIKLTIYHESVIRIVPHLILNLFNSYFIIPKLVPLIALFPKFTEHQTTQ